MISPVSIPSCFFLLHLPPTVVIFRPSLHFFVSGALVPLFKRDSDSVRGMGSVPCITAVFYLVDLLPHFFFFLVFFFFVFHGRKSRVPFRNWSFQTKMAVPTVAGSFLGPFGFLYSTNGVPNLPSFAFGLA